MAHVRSPNRAEMRQEIGRKSGPPALIAAAIAAQPFPPPATGVPNVPIPSSRIAESCNRLFNHFNIAATSLSSAASDAETATLASLVKFFSGAVETASPTPDSGPDSVPFSRPFPPSSVLRPPTSSVAPPSSAPHPPSSSSLLRPPPSVLRPRLPLSLLELVERVQAPFRPPIARMS